MNTFRRLVAGYIVMVGVPICGVLAVLAVGRHAVAPPAVGGEWRLQVRGADTLVVACGSERDAPVTILSIRQSGRYLDARFGTRQERRDPPLTGTIEGRRVHLEDDGGDCPERVQLDAELTGRAALTGVLVTSGGRATFSADAVPASRTVVPDAR